LRASNAACCRDIRRVALEKKLQLEAKIKAMRGMLKALDRLLAACSNGSRPVDDCPILAALEKGQRR
jgi:MerR family Zn(II)-responsive transcriptional regulator of zntA